MEVLGGKVPKTRGKMVTTKNPPFPRFYRFWTDLGAPFPPTFEITKNGSKLRNFWKKWSFFQKNLPPQKITTTWLYDHDFWGGFRKNGPFFRKFLNTEPFSVTEIQWSKKPTQTPLRAASKYAKIKKKSPKIEVFFGGQIFTEILANFLGKGHFWSWPPLWSEKNFPAFLVKMFWNTSPRYDKIRRN